MSSIDIVFADIVGLVRVFDNAVLDAPEKLLSIVSQIVEIVSSIGNQDLYDDTRDFIRQLFMGEIPSYGFTNLNLADFPLEVRGQLHQNFGVTALNF